MFIYNAIGLNFLINLNKITCEAIQKSGTVFNINVIAPREYADTYQKTHESLGLDLQKIVAEVEDKLKASQMFQKNNFDFKINLNSSPNHPLLQEINQGTCEGKVTKILDLLNKINTSDPVSNYILLVPCPPNNYFNIFESIDVDIPLIDYRSNIQCAKRFAIFQETQYSRLLAAFGNAVLKSLGASVDSYAKFNMVSRGDDGLETKMSISDPMVNEIVQSKCFIKSYKE